MKNLWNRGLKSMSMGDWGFGCSGVKDWLTEESRVGE